MTTDKTLQAFEDNMLKQVSPLEKTSIELLKKAKAQTITDNGSLARAISVKKEINVHSKLIKDSRMTLTRPLDDMKKLIMLKETEVTTPLNDAKANVSNKILAYEEELQRIAQEETERIETILDSLRVSVWDYTNLAEVTAAGRSLKVTFAKLDEKDQLNPHVKLQMRESVDALTTRKTNLEEEARQEAERKRLAKLAEKQNAAQAKLERQKAAQEAEERRLQAESDRQQREMERQAFEAEAQAQRKAAASNDKEKPKSNIATVTDIEITNEYLVDRKYCSPDLVKIRQAIKDGATEIAGVTITQRKQVR